MNQVELHPYLQQRELVDFCRENGIHLTAYSPLGSRDRPGRLKKEDEPDLLENRTIGNIAENHGCTPAQILIAWAIHRRTAVIPKSVNPGRIRENLAAAEVVLEHHEMEQIAGLDRSYRYVDGAFWVREGNSYTLQGLWG